MKHLLPVQNQLSSQKKTDSDEVDFSEMTKSQIETYGRKIGIELDRRQNKTDLIAKLEEFISKQEES